MMTITEVRNAFVQAYEQKKSVGDTVELIGTSFIADEETIFGTPNRAYQAAELQWYLSKSRSVNDIKNWYHKVPEIWAKVADANGMINSNYGWAVFSEENGSQYVNVLKKLLEYPDTRQAVMLYNRPSMHADAITEGMRDFMCCIDNHFFIRDNALHCIVQFRSNDAVYGYINDLFWVTHIKRMLLNDLHRNGRADIEHGDIIWQANSLHVYERHYPLIKAYANSHEYITSVTI